MVVISKILNWWRARQRAIDIDILWPSCKEMADDLDTARAVFMVHVQQDKAWLSLGETEIIRQIGELK